MPTIPGSKSNVSLTPQQALEQVSGLITELGDEPPAPVEPAVDAPQPPPETAPPVPSDTEAPAEPSPEDTQVYTVKVDGEPVEFTLEELKASASYQAHNTQRAQELAEKEKRLEPELRQRIAQEVAQERQLYQARLEEIRQALEQINGEPDWVGLRKEVTDAEFLKRKADWETAKAQTLRLRQEEQRVADLQQQEQGRQWKQYLQQEEEKLQTAVPEWKDVEKGKSEIAKLSTFVKTKYGIPDAQLAQAFTSSAAILLARDAMRYAELHRDSTATVKPRPSAIKAAKPGTPARPRPDAVQQKLIEQTKSGRHRDAAAAIAAMLPDD